MTRKTRRLLFYSLVFLFLIAGLAVVFYCDGWRINAQDGSIKLQRTGAIFIQTDPQGVNIKIGKEIFADKSGLFQKGTLAGELLPGNYEVEIKKNNYLSWTKNIAVESGLVSEASRIVLIPEKLEKNPVASDKPVDNFWVNRDNIVFKNSSGLYLQSKDSSTKLRGDKFVVWSNDHNKIITENSNTQTYYLYTLNNLGQTLNINVVLSNLQKTPIKDVKFHPLDSNRLIIQDKNNFLRILDVNRSISENIDKEPALTWTIEGPSVYYISDSLTSFNLISKTEDFSFKLPDNLTNKKFTRISVSANKIGLLDDSGGLYVFNQQTQNLQQIAHSAENFTFSPDSRKIAFEDKNGKLNIYFAEDYQNGIRKKAGDVIRFNFYLKSNGGNIKNISWYKDSSHLFVENQTSVDFTEIDDRQPTNKYTLTETASNFYYEQNSNRLYFIKKDNLYFFEI